MQRVLELIDQFGADYVPVQAVFDWGYNLISSMPFLFKVLTLVLGIVITVLGVFELIKKISKLLIFIAAIYAIYYLYTMGVFANLGS